MRYVEIISPDQAAALVKDGDTLITSGFVNSCLPEALNCALERRFLDTGSPRALTLFYPSSQGGRGEIGGGDHFAHEGLLRRVIAGHYATAPKLASFCLAGKCEAYNLPQGALVCLLRDIAGHRPGTITKVGLDTFADPKHGGGKVNECTKEELVETVRLLGEDWLLYKAFPIHVAFLRGTYADECGNVTLEKEAATTEVTSIAQAVKNSGGRVIVQVERIVEAGTLDPRLVKIPGIYVDAVVVAPPELHAQCMGEPFCPALCGITRESGARNCASPLTAKKLIARRSMLALRKNAVVNLGVGAPEAIAAVAAEEGIDRQITLTVESGVIGGNPQGGARFGSAQNPEAIIDQPYQFDFYDGGGLDMAFLGLAQCDRRGNINVSRFGSKLAGCGGFIDITQNAREVFFCGTFTTGRLKIAAAGGRLIIEQEGQNRKFIDTVSQITFSGQRAFASAQRVLYITERCVFKLCENGLRLTEIAPGIDLQTQILDLMDFSPDIDSSLKLMDARIFDPSPMGVSEITY